MHDISNNRTRNLAPSHLKSPDHHTPCLLNYTICLPQTAADEFYRNFNGVAYNSLEPETCHLVYVSRVDMVNESDEARMPIPGMALKR